MPPPRPSATACSHLRASARPFRYATCQFSTSTVHSLPQLGPESPNYIHVPQPPQPEAPYLPRLKGILPAPRKIFPRNGPNKTSPNYLAAVTPDPKPRPKTSTPPSPAHRSQIEWKTKLAEHRRRNLRESLHELKSRKVKQDKRLQARSTAKLELRERLLTAPTPAHEKHTTPSILSSALSTSYTMTPTERASLLALKKANHERHASQKIAERRNALHTLYTNARDFIVTEQALNEAVENVFHPGNPQFDNEAKRGMNVWNLGYPETVRELLDTANKEDTGSSVQRQMGYAGLTDKRMKRLGEELTGGKM
ncbi:MAG: hypothetical protein LQ350_001809 [Teloschistes chrysophthalmus]|nr:MAG: hypothetical protein LQ350_001809 [Niorma chrysophthalma]